MRRNTHRLGINFPFRWFRFSLRTWATAALTWAEGKQSLSMAEHAFSQPVEPILASLVLRLQFPCRTLPGNPFLLFLQGSCLSWFWIPLVKEHVTKELGSCLPTPCALSSTSSTESFLMFLSVSFILYPYQSPRPSSIHYWGVIHYSRAKWSIHSVKTRLVRDIFPFSVMIEIWKTIDLC
jgi:hypothetical protein